MTTAGLQVYGDHGFIQIDQDFMNPALLTKGSFSGASVVISVPNASTPVLALYATSSNQVALWYAVRIGAQIDFYVSGTGDYYVFDQPPAPATHGMGLQVFKADGSIAFDSSYAYLRPVASSTIVMSAASDGAAVPGVVIPAGKKYAGIFSNPGYWLQNDYPSSGSRSQGVWGLSVNGAGTGFTLHRNTIQTFGGNVPPNSFTNVQLTFADVTGL